MTTILIFSTDPHFGMGHGGYMQQMGMGPMNSCAPPAQPLPSNVLVKGGDRTMDQQYMQQSSQIYVFSTLWANRSAEAVMQEQYPSIIAWHESQPETKKHLEVNLTPTPTRFRLEQKVFGCAVRI